jgi:hypothetical protein
MNEYISVESFIEEIKADFRKQADAGLIDEASIYRDLELGLKRFGNDIKELQETIVHVKNGKVVLPSNFSALYIAYLCEPLGYSKDSTLEKHSLQDSMFYMEKVERDTKWNTCDPCCTETSEKVITESLFLNESKVDFHYHRPQLLSLGKSFNKNQCHDNCRNKFIRESPYEININRNTLHANFDKGPIYMQYYGLPVDEDGQLLIPNTENGHLETFLEYHVKERLIERLMMSSDGAGLASMFNIIAQKKSVALKNASSELKMGNINPNRFRARMRRLNTIETLKYSLNFRFH